MQGPGPVCGKGRSYDLRGPKKLDCTVFSIIHTPGSRRLNGIREVAPYLVNDQGVRDEPSVEFLAQSLQISVDSGHL